MNRILDRDYKCLQILTGKRPTKKKIDARNKMLFSLFDNFGNSWCDLIHEDKKGIVVYVQSYSRDSIGNYVRLNADGTEEDLGKELPKNFKGTCTPWADVLK